MPVIKTTQGLEFASKEGESVLAAALSNGFHFAYGCKNGQCGSCKTRLLDGEIKAQSQQLGLDDKEQQSYFLSCVCEPVSDIVIDAEDLTALKDIDIKILPVRLNTIKHLSDNIVQVDLRYPPSNSFSYLAGQYIDLIAPGGERRSYSIMSNPSENNLSLLIKRIEKGVLSKYWFDQAKQNDLLRIEGPKGSFYLRNTDKDLIFLATGTGIAPIYSILKSLDKENIVSNKNIKVYWGNRNKDDFVLDLHFENIQLSLCKVLSKDTKDMQGYEKGYVQDIAFESIKSKSIDQLEVYACGSMSMIQSAKDLFTEYGLAENAFFSDAFVSSY